MTALYSGLGLSVFIEADPMVIHPRVENPVQVELVSLKSV